MATGIRSEVNKAIEAARGDKTIGASLEAEARVYVARTKAARLRLRDRVAELEPFFIVSSLVFVDDAEEASGASSVRVAGAEAVALGLTRRAPPWACGRRRGLSARGAGSTTRAEAMGSDEKHPSCARGARRW